MNAAIHPGAILAGKFRVDRVLGQGGMGVVVAAWHLALEERVALKFLLPHVVEKPEIVQRFLREGRNAVKIRSEHVARVTDVGTLENGAPYMVMEYLEGYDISQFVEQRGSIPYTDAVDLLLQACEAIAEAHTLGIVHRDLKPANLFLTMRADGSPCVKVLDFGISKTTSGAGKSDSSLTKTTGMMGSPLYMSPEQLNSARDVDNRTDLWALGVILFEMLTAQPPFFADDLPQLIVQILNGSPAKLCQLRPDVPPQLQQIVEHALAKDRNQRFQNIAEFVNAIAPYGSQRGQLSVERVGRLVGTQTGVVVARSTSLSNTGPGGGTSSTSMGLGTNAPWGSTRPSTTQATSAKSKAPIFIAMFVFVGVVGAVSFFVLRPLLFGGHDTKAAANDGEKSASSATTPRTKASSKASSDDDDVEPTISPAPKPSSTTTASAAISATASAPPSASSAPSVATKASTTVKTTATAWPAVTTVKTSTTTTGTKPADDPFGEGRH